MCACERAWNVEDTEAHSCFHVEKNNLGIFIIIYGAATVALVISRYWTTNQLKSIKIKENLFHDSYAFE